IRDVHVTGVQTCALPILDGATGLLVAGAWVAGASTLSVRDKYTGAEVAVLASPDDEQLDAALSSAAAASRTEFPPSRRAAVLREIGRAPWRRRMWRWWVA